MDIQLFTDIKNKFLAYLASKQIAYNTQRSYRLDLNHITSLWHENSLELTLEKYQDLLLTSNLTSSSLARKVSCLNSLKRFLAIESIFINIRLKRPRVILKEPISLKENDISFVTESSDLVDLPTAYPLRDKAILNILSSTGIKSAELVFLELKDINFENNSINVINSNSSKNRIISLPDKVIERLKDYILKERPKSKSVYEKIFLNCKNTPLSVRSVQHICVMFRKFFKQDKLTPNLLRNSYAVKLLNSNLALEDVQEILGHKVRISTERYKNKSES